MRTSRVASLGVPARKIILKTTELEETRVGHQVTSFFWKRKQQPGQILANSFFVQTLDFTEKIMVNKTNDPQMAFIHVCEMFQFTHIRLLLKYFKDVFQGFHKPGPAIHG